MGKLTPMMAQYKAIKGRHQDCILMFRLGDFYEMFFEDAVEASGILDITLTARNKGGEEKTPMCGVPYHAVDGYLAKLTRAGKKVAICDQVTAPDGKGIVEREVIRIVTPGTTFDDNILDKKANNYVACVVEEKERFALSFCDVTTGEFKVSEFESLKELREEMGRLRAAEYVMKEELRGLVNEGVSFPYEFMGEAESALLKHFEVKSLTVFGLDRKSLAVKAAASLLNYLKETQKTDLKHIQNVRYYQVSDFMPLNESTVRNLELFWRNFDGKREASLIWVLDQTMTAMGGRMLRSWLMKPLVKKEQIETRLGRVEAFVNDSSLVREVRDELEKLFDVERLLSRLSIGSGNARDLVALKKSLEVVPVIKERLKGVAGLGNLAEDLNPLEELRDLIERAIKEDAPITVREGDMIADGYNGELDELRSISTEGKTFIKDLQEREAKRSGISSLKVKYNKVFGYYIEISKANLANVPEDYIRKQTLVNAERFITPELKEYEDKVLSAEDRIKELEYELFYAVRMEALKEIVALQKLARALAEIDVLSNFAYVAVKNNYVKPEMSDGVDFAVRDGRHPVIEKMNASGEFVPNDCEFGEGRKFVLITGPNMGGKSTYLRQVALISLMAQVGSFVPAREAKLGVVDRIFTRVGASDNLSRGESTFMVEMQETAYILNNASERSLVILDEIGRGTSTYDGVSIAWAIMEFMHDKINAKTLFATHYHELIELADKLDKACNMSVAVRENEREGVVFLYKVLEGGVDKSYGIEVAKLAGLGAEIVSRARGVLNELESRHIKKGRVHKDQTEMFEAREHRALQANEEVVQEILKIDLENMTPLESIRKLHDIKNKLS